MSALLQLSSVETYIGGSRILRGVDLEMNPGEVVALMGRNGVGKTTTLRSITGVLSVRSGSILFDGKPIEKLSIDVRARAGIGYVPQGRDIFPHMTVEENLHIGLVVHGRKGADAKAALERVYDLFPVLKDMLKRKGGVLSGGQQQQLAIGRALLTNPKLLILDEPTEGIQPSIIDQIGDTLKKLKAPAAPAAVIDQASKDVAEITSAVKKLKETHALAILLVEQYVDFCREVADRFYAMDRGVVVVSGPIASLTDEVVKEHLQV
ncbi:High-affinity branched-chain amino acid transport ATP-binding protein LivF [Lacunisphaera limnophila]|uniref:High-affinity branched-chain amino acid transport ATP-binding protein LivF n=1 Tax=Lacunisphaera limnophila TaxID=1838286 RepID=A0A1D8AWJ7_9BACT|nr:ABC transporter ATP-binding protein [Lacunisphaera limnophila]AOS45253.1 High-affinity branched-chain amino acid transport ATP-binding protein LivF [Lacunisphaera limnophila]